jgi:hypothetical protein
MKVDPRQVQAELDEDKALKEDLNNIEQSIEQLMADASVDNYIDGTLSFTFDEDNAQDWYFEDDCREDDCRCETIEDDYYDTW